jgi:hypothetical protein
MTSMPSYKERYVRASVLIDQYKEDVEGYGKNVADIDSELNKLRRAATDSLKQANAILRRVKDDKWVPADVKARLKGTALSGIEHASTMAILTRVLAIADMLGGAYTAAADDRDAFAEVAAGYVDNAAATNHSLGKHVRRPDDINDDGTEAGPSGG